MAKALLGKLAHHGLERGAHTIAPAVYLDLAVARGDVCHQQVAKTAGRDLGKAGLGHQHGTERDTAGAKARQLVDTREGTHATAHVDGEAGHLADRPDRLGVRGASALVLLESGREIHHVQPARALLHKGLGHGHGVLGVHLAARAVAALQAHHAPGNQVDSGKDDHAATSASATTRTKFLRISRPRAEDFSGWNWQPKTSPRCAMQAKLRV